MNRLALALLVVSVTSFAAAQTGPTQAVQPASNTQAATPSFSENEEPTSIKTPSKLRRLYLSFSPLHLILPMVEVTGEVRVHDRVGIAGIVGLGSIASKNQSLFVYEFGIQAVTYPLGDFDTGLRLGIEGQYLGLSGSGTTGSESFIARASGLSGGAFLGFKWTSAVGFALNIDGGIQLYSAAATASSATSTASASEVGVLPLININLGWAF